MPLQRTQYRIVATGTVRAGSTAHTESVVDVEDYLQPLDRLRGSSLTGSGVARELRVVATAGATGVRVECGLAVDPDGRLVVLEPGGVAIVDREVGADVVLNVPTEPVGPGGVTVPTSGLTGDLLLTVAWREVQKGAGDTAVLRPAPWLQLLPAGHVDVAAGAVPLARVVLGAAGTVTTLDPGPRRALPLTAGGLTLTAPAGGDPAVRQEPAGEVRARLGGGLELAPSGGGEPLSIDGDGAVSVAALSTGNLSAGSLSAGTLSVDDLTGTTVSATRLTADRVGIGTPDPGFALDVNDRVRLRQAGTPSAGLWLHQTGPAADRAFVGMADDDRVGFWGNPMGAWGVTMDVNTGELQADRGLRLPETGGGFATLGNRVVNGDAGLTANNLKLVMAESFGFFPSPPWEFMVGSVRTTPFGGGGPFGAGLRTRFVRAFGVDSSGNAFFAGGKGGYVVDYFVNAVGDTLERGDVVVLGAGGAVERYGTGGAIPIPEVDLTDRAYDQRVCGIVCDVVAAGSLPDPDPADWPEPAEGEDDTHPFARFAGAADADRTQVGDRQMGRMVTLGAYAFCKVDADVAPVAAGDLLTTSTTRGHAQKVTDHGDARGAVVGKAMAPLESGRGLVPVLVGLT